MSQDDSSPLTRDIAPFGVRMPPDLKDRVATAAKANNRSMNAEIVATLEEKYPAPAKAEISLVHLVNLLSATSIKDSDEGRKKFKELSELLDDQSGGRLEIFLDPTATPSRPGSIRVAIRARTDD